MKMSWKRPVACLTALVFSLSQLVPPAYALRPSASAQSPTFQHDFAQEFPEALATRLGSDNLSWQAEDILGQAVTEGRAFVLAGSGARKPEEVVVVSYLEAYQRRFPTSTPPVESAAMTSRIRRAGDALTQAFAQISVVIDGQTVPAPSRLQAVVVFTEADDPALIGRVGDVRHRALIAYGAVHRSLPISLLQLEAFLEQGEPGRQALIEYLRIFAQSVVAGSYAEVEEGAVARVDAALASTQRQHGQTDWLRHRQQFVQAHTQHALAYARTMNVSAGPTPTAEHADALTIPASPSMVTPLGPLTTEHESTAAAVAAASTTPPSPQASAFLAAFRPAGRTGPTIAEERSKVREGVAAEPPPLAAMAVPTEREEYRVYDKEGKLVATIPKVGGRGKRLTLAQLDGVTVRGARLNASKGNEGGLAFAGRMWGRWTAYPNAPVEFDVEQGKVTEVRILNEGGGLRETVRLARIERHQPDGTWKLEDVFYTSPSVKRFASLDGVTIKNWKLGEKGSLSLGGRTWAAFQSNPNAPVEFDVEQGKVVEARVLNPDGTVVRTEPLSRVERWQPDGRRILEDVFYRIFASGQFAQLDQVTITRFHLNSNGGLVVGNRRWVAFPALRDAEVEFDVEQGKVTEVRVLRPDGSVQRTAPFARIERQQPDGAWVLEDVFYGLGGLLPRQLAQLDHVTIKGARLNSWGVLNIGGRQWLSLASYANALIEYDVEQGKVTQVRILKENGSVETTVPFVRIERQAPDGTWILEDVLFRGGLSAEEFGRLDGVTLRGVKLNARGELHIGGRYPWVSFYNYPRTEVDLQVEHGDIVSVKLVRDRNGKPIDSRTGLGFGPTSRWLFPKELTCLRNLAGGLQTTGFSAEQAMTIAETLLRLRDGSLRLLQQEHLLTDIEVGAIKSLELDHIENAELGRKLREQINLYQENGLSPAFSNRLLATHLLPWAAIERLQRTYRLGRNLGLISQALNHPDVEAWIRRVRETQEQRGTLDTTKHLQRYDPARMPVRTPAEREALMDDLHRQLQVLRVLLARSQQIELYPYDLVAQTHRAVIVRLAGTGTLAMPRGEELELANDGLRFEVQGSNAQERLLTLRETSGLRSPLPQSGIFQRGSSDVSLRLQTEAITQALASLEATQGRTTGSPVVDRLFGLVSLTPGDPTTNPVQRFVNPRIPYRRLNAFESTGDQAQETAVQLALNPTQVCRIEGPAGTGKTTVIAEVIRQALLRGQIVLLTSQMHQAVDNAVAELLNDPMVPVLRLANNAESLYYGTEAVWPGNRRIGIREPVLREFERRRQALGTPGYVLVATDIGLATDWFFTAQLQPRFPGADLLIMDETSRETLAGALVPMRFLKPTGKLVVVGDTKQLPPFTGTESERRALRDTGIPQEVQAAFYQSFFEWLLARPFGDQVMLSTNYRSHPLLAGLDSALFYEGDVHRRGWEDFDAQTLSLQVIDLAEESEQYYEDPGFQYRNSRAADYDVRLVQRFQTRGIPLDAITIVTPYRDQLALLEARLQAAFPTVTALPIVTTIDSYQGGENRVIIIDFVRSNPAGRVGFIDPRRFNVALSRAQDNLVIVWDSRTFTGETSSTETVEDRPIHALFQQLKAYYESEVQTFLPESEEGLVEPMVGPGGGTILEQPNRLLQRGDQLAEEGRVAEAIEAYQKAIHGDDENGVLGFDDIIVNAGNEAIVEAAKANKALAEARIATAQARLGASAVAAAGQEGGMTTPQPSQLPQKVPQPVSTLLQAQGLAEKLVASVGSPAMVAKARAILASPALQAFLGIDSSTVRRVDYEIWQWSDNHGPVLRFVIAMDAGQVSFYAKLRDGVDSTQDWREELLRGPLKDVRVTKEDPAGDWIAYQREGSLDEVIRYRRNPTTLEYQLALEAAAGPNPVAPLSIVIEDALVTLEAGTSLTDLADDPTIFSFFLAHEEELIKKIGEAYGRLNKERRIFHGEPTRNHIHITRNGEVRLIDFTTDNTTGASGRLSRRIPAGDSSSDLPKLITNLSMVAERVCEHAHRQNVGREWQQRYAEWLEEGYARIAGSAIPGPEGPGPAGEPEMPGIAGTGSEHQGPSPRNQGPGAPSELEAIDLKARRLQQLEQWLPPLAALNVAEPTEAQQQELTQLLRSFATWQAEDPALWAESLTAVLARLPEAAAPLRALLAREAPGLLPAQPEATPVTPVKAGAVQNAHPPKQSSTELDAAFTAQAQHVLDGVRHVLGAGVPPGLSEAAVDGAYGDASGERARLRTVIQEALRPELSTDEPMPSILFLDPSGSRSLFWVNGASRAVHVSAQDHALYFSWPAITTILEFLEARGERGVQAIAFATFVRMAGFTDEATAALTHERYPGYDDVTLLLGLLAEDEGEPPTTSAGAPAAEEPSATNATVDLLTRDTVVRNQQEVAWQSTPQLDMPRGTGLNPLGWFQQMIQQRATQSPDGQPQSFTEALQEWDVTVVRYPSGSHRCAFGHHIVWGFNYVHPSGVRIELGQDEVVSFWLLTESAKEERKRTYRLSAQEANDQQPSLSGYLAALRDHLPALLASGPLSPEDTAKLKAFAKLAGTPGYYSLIDVLGQSVEWEGRLLPLTYEDLQRFYELVSSLADTGVIHLDRRRVLPTELQRLRLQIASAVQQAQRGDPSGWDRIAAKYSQLLENIAAFSIKVAALVRFFGLVRSAERPAAAKAPEQLQRWAFIASGPSVGVRAMTHLRTLLAVLGLSLGGMTFTDVDFSQAMLDQGQAAVAALRDEGGHPLAHQTVRADIANEPLTTLEAHSFDVVETGLMGTLGEAANHAGFSKKIHLLLELNRVLDDGGYLLLTFKNKPLPPAFQQTLAEHFGLTILSPERPDLGYDADTLQRLTNGDAKKRAKLQTHLRGASYCVAVKTHTLTDPEREAIRAQQDAIAKTLVYDDSDEAPPGRPGRPRAPPTQAEETDIADVDYTRLTLEQADEAVLARETIQTDPEYEAFEERLAALLFGRGYLQPSEQTLLDRLVFLWDTSDVEVLRASHVGFVMDRPSQATGERRLQVRQLMRHHPHLAPRLTQQLRDKIEAAEQPLRVSLARLHGDLTTADLAEMARAERQAERTFLNAELTLWQLYELEEAHRAQANLQSVFEELRAQIVGQMRRALQRGRPDLLERYQRWDRLSSEEQDAFREEVYGLTHSDWNSWGFWRGSAISALLRFFSDAHLSPLGFGLRWSTPEEGIESVRYVLQQQQPDLINQYDRWDTLTPEEQTTFRLECYRITSPLVAAWGLSSAYSQDRAPYFEGSYITMLQMVFPKATLDRRGLESEWGTPEQGIEKVRQALREHRPDLLEQYARWETLTPEEQTTFRLECYPIQQNTFLEWSLRNALAQDRNPYFGGSYITTLQVVFPKANLDRRGFTSVWGTPEQGIEKVRQALREHRPDLLEQYARWETLTPEEQTAFRLAAYPIQRADFKRWNLDLRLVEYFERSHITALLMVFSKASLDRRGFESEWGTPEQGIEKVRTALRQHRPDLTAQYDRWRTLTPEEQATFRQAVDAIAPRQFSAFGLGTARSSRSAPYFEGSPRTALHMAFSNAFPEEGAVTAPHAPSEPPPREPMVGPGGGTILEQPNRLLTQGDHLAEVGRMTEAIAMWQKAIRGDDENGVLGFDDVIAHTGTGAIVEAAKQNKALAEARIATAQERLGASAVAAAGQEGGMTTPQPSQLPQKVPKPVSTPWRDLLQAQGLDPDQLMDLEQAVKRAADLTQPVYVGVHSSAFFGAPDVAMALTAIQQAVAESLKGGKLLEGEHPPQSALRFVLLVDGATDAKNAKRIAEALAEAMPEASGQSAHLNLELFALTLPAAIDEGRGQELFDLVSTLDGPTDQRGIVGALIGPTEWVESFGHTVTTRQGHEVAAFDSKQQQDGKTLVPGGQLVVQAVTRAVEVVVTVKVETRPPDVMPDRQRVIVLPALPLVGDLQDQVRAYRQSLETNMRSVRATGTKA